MKPSENVLMAISGMLTPYIVYSVADIVTGQWRCRLKLIASDPLDFVVGTSGLAVLNSFPFIVFLLAYRLRLQVPNLGIERWGSIYFPFCCLLITNLVLNIWAVTQVLRPDVGTTVVFVHLYAPLLSLLVIPVSFAFEKRFMESWRRHFK